MTTKATHKTHDNTLEGVLFTAFERSEKNHIPSNDGVERLTRSLKSA
jgi:hypothetical protein